METTAYVQQQTINAEEISLKETKNPEEIDSVESQIYDSLSTIHQKLQQNPDKQDVEYKKIKFLFEKLKEIAPTDHIKKFLAVIAPSILFPTTLTDMKNENFAKQADLITFLIEYFGIQPVTTPLDSKGRNLIEQAVAFENLPAILALIKVNPHDILGSYLTSIEKIEKSSGSSSLLSQAKEAIKVAQMGLLDRRYFMTCYLIANEGWLSHDIIFRVLAPYLSLEKNIEPLYQINSVLAENKDTKQNFQLAEAVATWTKLKKEFGGDKSEQQKKESKAIEQVTDDFDNVVENTSLSLPRKIEQMTASLKKAKKSLQATGWFSWCCRPKPTKFTEELEELIEKITLSK